MKFEDLNLKNVENIEEGMIFKNRRELCEYLGVKYASKGKRIKAQTEKIEYIFAYHKDGHKIIVDDVYPLAIIELNFQLSTNRQKKISELLILDLILSAIDNNDEALIINQNVLIPYLALANKNYIYYYYNKNNELAKKLGIEVDYEKTLNSWLSSVRSSLKSSIKSAIKQLKKEGCILYNEVYKVETVRQENEIFAQDGLNKYGDKIINYKSEHSTIKRNIRIAEDGEINKIMAIEIEVLEEMGCTKQDLVMSGKYTEFNKMCLNKTIERLGIGFYFKCHKFNFATSFIKDKKMKVIEELKNENVYELKYELNSLMCEKVRQNSQKRIEKHNEYLKSINDEIKELSDENLGLVNAHQIRDLMQSYEKELGKSYLNTKEHKDIEERLINLLIVIKDLDEDTKSVWYDKILDKKVK